MKVLVAGATGFSGAIVVPLLLKEGIEVRALVRASSDVSVLPANRVELAKGDLKDPSCLEDALQGVDALIHIPNLISVDVPKTLAAIKAATVKRAIFIGTTSMFTTVKARSKALRAAAERCILESDLEYTIIRPTMIYGSRRDRNMCRLITFLRRQPVMPVVGRGDALQQPVYVGDVARAMVQALTTPTTTRKCYNIAGAAPLTFNEVVDTIGTMLGRRVVKVHLPVRALVAALALFEKCSIRLPIKAEQIVRLNENKTFDYDDAGRDFHYSPVSFAEGIRMEMQDMGIPLSVGSAVYARSD
jgi:uncharacterized protein YbjT (DUF2867 family)